MSTVRALRTGIIAVTHPTNNPTRVGFSFLMTIFLTGADVQSLWCAVLLSAATTSSVSSPIKWCAVGTAETEKCDQWRLSILEGEDPAIECPNAPTVEECLKMIMVKKNKKKTAVQGGDVKNRLRCILPNQPFHLTHCCFTHPAA